MAPSDSHPDHGLNAGVRLDASRPEVQIIPPSPGEPSERSHPDVLAACMDAHVLPERLWFTARTDERTTARRAVACRLLAAGWKPGRVRRLLGLSRWQLARYARACPGGINARAWRIEPGTPDSAYKRKVRRCREKDLSE